MNMRPFRIMLALLTLAGGSVALSRAVHEVPLAPVLDAERRAFVLPDFGRVAFYGDPSGTGRPLVLTHSVNAAANAFEMQPIFESFRGQRPVYVLEWPGFGSSLRADVPYTPELMSRALAHFVGLLDTEVDVVSLSLGSEFAARAALSEPRIRSLALLSPTGLGDPRGASQEAAQEQGQARYNSLRPFGSPLFAVISSRPSIRYFLSQSFVGPVNRGLYQASLDSSWQAGAKHAPLYFLSGLLFSSDALSELYSKLQVPVLVLYDRDAFVNFNRLPDFEAQENVQAVRISPTLGLPHFEQMGQVRRALDEFYAQPKQ